MIIGVFGKMGSGKTLFTTALAYHFHQKKAVIYANYGLKFDYKPLSMKEISDFKFNFSDSVLLIDEIHLFIDSRASMTKKNKILSYFITQSRKRNIILIYTTQQLHQVDKRLRANTDYFIQCENMSPKMKENVYIRWSITDSGNELQSYVFKADPYFKLYDTHQLIDFDTTK